RRTYHSVAIEVLLKRGLLEIFQHSAGSRNDPGNILDHVAIAVCRPYRILISAGNLEGHVVATRRLLNGNRRSRKLTHHYGRAVIFERGARAAAGGIKEIVTSNLVQLGQPE